ncbi:MAG: electron transfer flavoprotein subunit alpha/FixB family protein [Anaerolineae bacterium]
MILALIDHEQGTLNETSLEMLTLGRELAQSLNVPLAAVLIGEAAHPLADGLAAHGISIAFAAAHPRLTAYAPDAWAHTLHRLIEAEQPPVVLAPGSERGNDVLARLAARAELPFAANCIAAKAGEPFTVTRLRWGGSLLEEAHLPGAPKLLSVAPHTLPAEAAPAAASLAVRPFTPTLADDDFRVQVAAREETAGDRVSLAEARIVVGGGRGVGSAEGFAVLEELAALLGGAVGCSRAVTNHGWRPHAEQVGQTGTRIAPEIYIACGISGAIQHMVGCKGARHILAVNTDPEAPIIARADTAIIGDLHKVLPAIVSLINEQLSRTTGGEHGNGGEGSEGGGE